MRKEFDVLDLQEERMLLLSLVVCDYHRFKETVLGDEMAVVPPDRSLRDLIEEHLRSKYGARYRPDSPGWLI